MKLKKKFAVFTLIAVGFSFVIVSEAWSDRERRGRRGFSPTQEYVQACGPCHMAYPPPLLPAASWEKLVPPSGEHEGSNLGLSPQELQQLRIYILNNSADRGGYRLGHKISRSLGSAAPERLEDVPYLQRKHRKVDPAVFKRASVGGMSNCVACHAGAPQGDFEDDRVSIPK